MRKIIHCDCDCFYAAVEMRDNPSLQNIPLAIGGSADRRGVIATCNYLARQFGVRSAMSTSQALKRCPHLTVMRGNMDKYREVSRQIMLIYREATSVIEPVSLDEAYLDVTRSELCHGSATRIADYLRQRVRAEVGITISAGVAPNKFLAKVASDWRKPDGLFVIAPAEVAEFVRHLPVAKLHGVGCKTAAKLSAMGIVTCQDVQQKEPAELMAQLGSFGERLSQLSHGIDERPVHIARSRKSISVEHTYTADLKTLEQCTAQIPTLWAELDRRYARLAANKSVQGVVMKLKFSDFMQTTIEQQAELVDLTLLAALLREGFERGQGRSVRLLGIGYRLQARTDQPQQLLLW